MLKHFRSLMLTCMAFFATAAFAGGWTVPAPNGTSFTPGENLYMWNVGEQGFAYLGEAWGSQAVLSKTNGLTFKWTESSEGSGVYNAYDNHTLTGKKGQYVIRVNSDANAGKGARTLFVDGALGRSHFKINDLGNGKYTIQMAPDDGDGEEITEENKENLNSTGEGYSADWYVGIQTDYEKSLFYQNEGVTYALWYDLQYNGNPNCEWLFVTADAYKVYAAKASLVEKMEEAEEAGVDVSAAEAVLNNANATVDDVNNAINALVNAIANQVTPDNPVDMTSLIKEATCDSHSYWVSTAIAANDNEKIQNNAIATNRCTDAAANVEGAFEGKFWENWDASAWTGKMYQTVRNVPQGVYKASLAAFVNILDENNAVEKCQYVFFNDVKRPITTVNNRKYEATVFILEGVDTLDIGLAQDKAVANWAGVDNASLLYYGNGLESYQYPARELSENIDEEIESIVEGRDLASYYTQSYYDAFEAAVAASEASTVVADAIAALQAAVAARDALLQNVALWCQIKDQRDEVEALIFDDGLALDALIDEIDGWLDAAELTNEELLVKIEYIKEAIQEAKVSAYKEGDEVTTIFIENPNFSVDGSANTKGWEKAEGYNNTFKGGTSGVIEAWDASFNVYQDLKGLQNGAYELEIQGYYRTNDSAEAYASWVKEDGQNRGDNIVESFLYADENEAPFVNIMAWGLAEAGDGEWTGPHDDGLMRPNDVTSANWAFNSAESPYHVKVIGVVTDGTLRVGLKNTTATNHCQWSIWNGVKMTYLAFNADLIRPALTSLIESVGIADAPMYSGDKKELTDAIANAESAANGSDGQAMIVAYKRLSAAIQQAEPSASAYTKLVEAQEKLIAAIEKYRETATSEALAEAEAMVASIENAVASGTWTKDEATEKTKAALELIGKLKIPGGVATDENPLDYTFMIVNPDFMDDEGLDSKTGWTVVGPTDWHVGVQYNIMEGFECTFECYQDITGLPAGTYEVRCKGFFRDESSDQANDAYLNDTTEIRGKLFAESAAMLRQESDLANVIVIDEECLNAPGSEGNWKTITIDGTTYFYPNMREAARLRFEAGFYDNAMVVKVGEDGKLRLGFCNKAHKKNDWAATSNYELWYFGTNSSKQPNHDVDAIHTVSVKAEKNNQYYDLQGRKVNVPTAKGIYIINGKKVLVK